MESLFCRLIRFTKQEEDFFTECLAEILHNDPDLMVTFLEMICGKDIDGVSIRDAKVSIESQQCFSAVDGKNKSVPDLVIRVGEQKILGIENKLGAPLGPRQLEKYLAIDELDKLKFHRF